jgi:hypothetical protein
MQDLIIAFQLESIWDMLYERPPLGSNMTLSQRPTRAEFANQWISELPFNTNHWGENDLPNNWVSLVVDEDD